MCSLSAKIVQGERKAKQITKFLFSFPSRSLSSPRSGRVVQTERKAKQITKFLFSFPSRSLSSPRSGRVVQGFGKNKFGFSEAYLKPQTSNLWICLNNHPSISNKMEWAIVVYFADDMKCLPFCVGRNCHGGLRGMGLGYCQCPFAYFFLLPPVKR